MDQQTIDAELTYDGARELLASTAAAHLAYVAKDGTPRVVPVGFYWPGEEWVHGYHLAEARGAVRAPGCLPVHRHRQHPGPGVVAVGPRTG